MSEVFNGKGRKFYSGFFVGFSLADHHYFQMARMVHGRRCVFHSIGQGYFQWGRKLEQYENSLRPYFLRCHFVKTHSFLSSLRWQVFARPSRACLRCFRREGSRVFLRASFSRRSELCRQMRGVHFQLFRPRRRHALFETKSCYHNLAGRVPETRAAMPSKFYKNRIIKAESLDPNRLT